MVAKSDKPLVFISYARKDGNEYANRVHKELEKLGLQVWRDQRSLDPYQDFSAEIELALRAADYVVVCVTPEVVERPDGFVRREIIYADALSQHNDKPKIIPLLFPGVTLPPITIVHLTWIPFYKPHKTNEIDLKNGFKVLRERFGVISKPGLTAPDASVMVEVITEATDTPAATQDTVLPSPAKPDSPFPSPLETQPRQLSSDPFYEYVFSVYNRVVDDLDKTVFSLITLKSMASPDAVESPQVLPMSFSDNQQRYFDNFPEAFKHYDSSVLLLGEPGAGKTTTLMAYAREALAHRLEDPSQPLPIVMRIPEWLHDQQPTLDVWISQNNSLPLDAVQRELAAGRVLLLLDGLDELGDHYEAQDENVLTRIKQAIVRFDPRLRFIEMVEASMGSNHILITCRNKDYQEIGKKIRLGGAIRLRPLDNDQMAQYLLKEPDLLQAIRSDRGLREMAQTPLLLSLLTFTYGRMDAESRQQLRNLSQSPSELRDKIFASYVRGRFDHEAHRTNVQLIYDLSQTYEALGNFAVETINNLKKPEELLKTIKISNKQLTDEHLNRFLDQMRQMHILIGDQQELRFIHLLLRDHFASTYIFNTLAQPSPTRFNLQKSKQFGTVQSDKSAKRLFSSDLRISTYIKPLTQLNDARALEPLIEYVQEQAKQEKLLSTNDFHQAIVALGNLNSTKATPVLVSIIQDANGRIKKAERLNYSFSIFIPFSISFFFTIMVLVIGIAGQNVISVFQGFGFSLAPTSAVLHLSILLGWISFGLIASALLADEIQTRRYRMLAAEALGKIGDADALPTLQKAAESKNRRLRKAAIKAISTIEHRKLMAEGKQEVI